MDRFLHGTAGVNVPFLHWNPTEGRRFQWKSVRSKNGSAETTLMEFSFPRLIASSGSFFPMVRELGPNLTDNSFWCYVLINASFFILDPSCFLFPFPFVHHQPHDWKVDQKLMERRTQYKMGSLSNIILVCFLVFHFLSLQEFIRL